jgi:putative DNA primase/helicase
MFVEFKANEKFASKGADQSEFHESFADAGYLLKDSDLVVDIDNLGKEKIKEMINYFDINTKTVWTDKGAHLYFVKPKAWKGKSVMVTPLGFEAEFKTIKNTPAGITIKRNGKLRDIENPGNRCELPDFLYNGKHNLDDLFGLDEGDGRDNKLYAHTSKIMNVTNHKNALRFINTHILAKPFNEDDFQRITRDREITAEKGNESDVAKQLIKMLNIVEYADKFYYYSENRYKTGNLKREIAKYLDGSHSEYINEVYKQIDLRPNIVEQPDKGFDIKFRNGILRNGKFIEVDSQEFSPYFINIEHDEEAEPVKAVDDYLDQLTEGDPVYRNLVLEMIAHCLITNVEFKRKLARFSIIIGKGGEGKGTLLEIIGKILGSENCSSVSLDRLPDERYNYGIEGKLCNLGDDVSDKPINNEQMKWLKNISTCDNVDIRHLNKMSRKTRLTASLIFTTNHMLKSHEKDDSYKRRVVWCPMMNKPIKADGEIISKLTSEPVLEYWIKLIVEAYYRLHDNKGFTVSDKVQAYTDSYHADSCEIWVQEKGQDYFLNKRPPAVYSNDSGNDYVTWAEDNFGKAQSARILKATIEKIHDLKVQPRKFNGKSSMVYVKAKS